MKKTFFLLLISCVPFSMFAQDLPSYLIFSAEPSFVPMSAGQTQARYVQENHLIGYGFTLNYLYPLSAKNYLDIEIGYAMNGSDGAKVKPATGSFIKGRGGSLDDGSASMVRVMAGVRSELTEYIGLPFWIVSGVGYQSLTVGDLHYIDGHSNFWRLEESEEHMLFKLTGVTEIALGGSSAIALEGGFLNGINGKLYIIKPVVKAGFKFAF